MYKKSQTHAPAAPLAAAAAALLLGLAGFDQTAVAAPPAPAGKAVVCPCACGDKCRCSPCECPLPDWSDGRTLSPAERKKMIDLVNEVMALNRQDEILAAADDAPDLSAFGKRLTTLEARVDKLEGKQAAKPQLHPFHDGDRNVGIAQEQALARSLPLVTFVGQPTHPIPGCVVCRWDECPNVPSPCVVVATKGPLGVLTIKTVLRGTPPDAQIVAAAGLFASPQQSAGQSPNPYYPYDDPNGPMYRPVNPYYPQQYAGPFGGPWSDPAWPPQFGGVAPGWWQHDDGYYGGGEMVCGPNGCQPAPQQRRGLFGRRR